LLDYGHHMMRRKNCNGNEGIKLSGELPLAVDEGLHQPLRLAG